MKILAIDPGASGGFAWCDGDAVGCCPMPQTEGDVLDKLREISSAGIRTIIIEDQNGFCGNACPGSAMFNFGRGFGFILGAAQAVGFSIELVRPQKWQKALSLGSKKEHAKDWKNHLKAEAQRFYPSVAVTLKTADALLLLEYFRRVR